MPDDASTLAAEEDLLAAVRRAGYDARVTGRRGDAPVAPHRPVPRAADPHGEDVDRHGEAPRAEHGPRRRLAAHGPTSRRPVRSRDGPGHPMDDDADLSAPTPDRGADLRRRLRVSAVLTVPVLALSMVPALQVAGWQWVVAALALPVATWAAWPFHRAAARAARHRASTMDTLVSIGIVAATAWSLWALCSAAPAGSGCGWSRPSGRPTPTRAWPCRSCTSRSPPW